MMIRPAELAAIRDGEVDLAFRRWDRPRVRVGTRMRTAVGVLEVTQVERVALSSLRAEDARRAGAPSLAALREGLGHRPDRSVFRVGLRYAGPDPREALREQVPGAGEIEQIRAWLDRLDAASRHGPWTRATLQIIDRSPGVRAPELAAELGRETAEWKADVRKLKEKGLTESLAIGYRLSPRGEAVLDHGGPPRERAPRPPGTPVPRSIGAPATRGLRDAGVTTLEQVAEYTLEQLRALHGVGPIAVERLAEALAERGLTLRSP
ncbi:hypothetical protein [Ornithinimicrobium pekingense]|uniref:Helix-hairpin-helix domain-containing protein n=1 Tax=Ornithinimicrobium pekingense TaxID=384677 RepID=A0ABQ2F469_9MICO|nr:hypothetical protein [Ornithinimicrobium pekingense]GGK58639.1 hypothetical protein GCM10011509_03770 [Ornithinimicrobium pekingense]